MATHIGSFTMPPINPQAAALVHNDPKSDEAKEARKDQSGKAQINLDENWYVAFKWDVFRHVETVYGIRQGKREGLGDNPVCPWLIQCTPQVMDDGAIHYVVAAQPRIEGMVTV